MATEGEHLEPIYPEMTLRCRDCGAYWNMPYEYDQVHPLDPDELVPVPVEEGGDECPVCGSFGDRVDSPWAGAKAPPADSEDDEMRSE